MSLFDIECTEEESSVVITPVNWEVTTSYGGGTSLAPDQIREASVQIDHFSAKYPTHNSPKYFLRECNDAILKSSQTNQKKAQEVYETSPEDKPELLKQVNEASEALNDWVYQETKKTLEKGKIAGSLGGGGTDINVLPLRRTCDWGEAEGNWRQEAIAPNGALLSDSGFG